MGFKHFGAAIAIYTPSLAGDVDRHCPIGVLAHVLRVDRPIHHRGGHDVYRRARDSVHRGDHRRRASGVDSPRHSAHCVLQRLHHSAAEPPSGKPDPNPSIQRPNAIRRASRRQTTPDRSLGLQKALHNNRYPTNRRIRPIPHNRLHPSLFALRCSIRYRSDGDKPPAYRRNRSRARGYLSHYKRDLSFPHRDCIRRALRQSHRADGNNPIPIPPSGIPLNFATIPKHIHRRLVPDTPSRARYPSLAPNRR